MKKGAATRHQFPKTASECGRNYVEMQIGFVQGACRAKLAFKHTGKLMSRDAATFHPVENNRFITP